MNSTIYYPHPPPGNLVYEEQFKNEEFHTFDEVCLKFLVHLKEVHIQHIMYLPSSACIAVAGPVDSNKVSLTNRSSWVIDGNVLPKILGIPIVKIINDFAAAGFGLLCLGPEDTYTLQDVPGKEGYPIACVGAGTGLGECFLTPDKHGHYTCFSSEGGHSEFAPRNDLEIELLKFLSLKFESHHRISVERIVSGPGIANVYEFLAFK